MPTATQIDLHGLAMGYREGGLSLVPCSHNDKRPDCRLLPKDETGKAVWEPYQKEAADHETVGRWFASGCQSVAAVGGAVSGGLLMLDFDAAGFYERWQERVGCLADGLPVQRTGRDEGGYQVWLRCPEPGRSTKLAYVPDESEPEGRRVAIETRGESGYAVLPGSLHPTGRRYEVVSGDFANIPTVPQAVADALLEAARKLDEAPLTRQQMQQREAAAKTCNKHRADSNGQASVIDAYNAATTIETALDAHGYSRGRERWIRPGGEHETVKVADGRSFHWGSNDPLCDGHWHRPFDVFAHYRHGGDCRAAVKAAAELLGMSADKNGPAATDRPIEYRGLTCAELDRNAYDLEYLIENVLVARQPCILAGGKKCMKTSILIDIGISLAMGGRFLGYAKVNRAARVGIMTGESGLATVQETARRIAEKAGYSLGDVGGLVFSEDLPRFGSLLHEDALRRFIDDYELEVVCIDPAYMAMPGTDAGNLFIQGELLRGVTKVCTETGCTMILAHHCRKTKVDPFSPPELEDIAWAGFQEFARQWLLVGRRELYQPGSGEHRLWLSVGGSAGHGALWALDINEGTRETPGGRYWDCTVMRADEARKDVQERQEQTKREKMQERLEIDRKEVVAVAAKGADSKSGIRGKVSCGYRRFDAAFASLVADGTLRKVELERQNGHTYPAWELNTDA